MPKKHNPDKAELVGCPKFYHELREFTLILSVDVL